MLETADTQQRFWTTLVFWFGWFVIASFATGFAMMYRYDWSRHVVLGSAAVLVVGYMTRVVFSRFLLRRLQKADVDFMIAPYALGTIIVVGILLSIGIASLFIYNVI